MSAQHTSRSEHLVNGASLKVCLTNLFCVFKLFKLCKQMESELWRFFSFSNWWREQYYFTFCLMTADGLRHRGEKFYFTDTCRDCTDSVWTPHSPSNEKSLFCCFNCRIYMQNIFFWSSWIWYEHIYWCRNTSSCCGVSWICKAIKHFFGEKSEHVVQRLPVQMKCQMVWQVHQTIS